MTSDDQQVSAPPRPTRRLTGLHGHSVQADSQHRPSLSSAATEGSVPEETSPGEIASCVTRRLVFFQQFSAEQNTINRFAIC